MDAYLGIIFGVIAMLGFGLCNAVSQVPVRKIGSTKTVFFRGALISGMYLIVLAVFWSKINFNLQYILIAFAIALLGYIPLVTFYKALEKGRVGVVTPVANSSVIFTILFSVIFFGESLNTIQVVSMVAVVIGIFLISVDFKNLKGSHLLKLSSGIPYALVSCLLWGLVISLFKIPVTVLGPILTSFIIEFGNTIYSGIHLKVKKASMRLPSKKIFKYVFWVALFGAIGTLFLNLGIAVSKVSIVAAITFSNPWITVLYGKFVYKEKLRPQQWLAIGIILCGIVLISSF